MGVAYLLDTNTIIAYLDNKLPEKAAEFIEANSIQLSVISRIELLSWPQLNDDQIQVIQAFIRTANVIDLHEEVVVKTSELRRSGLKIKLPDGIIAATALVHNLTLLTRNTSDFKHVPELQIMDPFL